MNLIEFRAKINAIALASGFKTVKDKILFDEQVADTELPCLRFEYKGSESNKRTRE